MKPQKLLVASVLVLVLLLSAFALSVSRYAMQGSSLFEPGGTFLSNLGFFFLININIVFVMLLVFLVIKNIVKLVLDRRNRILGSKVRSRLVIAFVGLSLVPTVLLFIVSNGILQSVLQGWFSPQISRSVDGALAVARYQYEDIESRMHHHAKFLVHELLERFPSTKDIDAPNGKSFAPADLVGIEQYLETKRAEYGVLELTLANRFSEPLVSTAGAEARTGQITLPAVQQAALDRAVAGEIDVRAEQSPSGEFIRAYAPVGEPTRFALVITAWISPNLSSALSKVVDSYDDYQELHLYRRPLASSYLLTLIVVTLMVMFAAIWVGFYLARGLSVPISLLAQGTEEIAQGNLTYRIPEIGDDELSVLVRSFNTMTADLRNATTELIERRQRMEAILEHLVVGVISTDANSVVTTINAAATQILDLKDTRKPIGRRLDELLPHDLGVKLSELTTELQGTEQTAAWDSCTVNLGNQTKHLNLTITQLVEGGVSHGFVILVNDSTELVNAQRVAAWREVARRIAHEIKNPLTPIQLAAQRMQRRFSRFADVQVSAHELRIDEAQLISESTNLICKQVEDLRNLVNEFSRFARMPQSKPQPSDLNKVLSETASLYRGAHPEIAFHEKLANDLPIFSLDPDQIRRAIMNLVDNAIAAIALRAERTVASGILGNVTIESAVDMDLGLVTIVVTDDGIGIAEDVKPRLFEPYFTTKVGGTGLGLAIVNAVIADHSGFVRVKDNIPHGTSFVIELPLAISEELRKTA